MFKDAFLKSGLKTVIFLVVYTILFFLFFATLKYTLPFVLGFAISRLVTPLNKWMKKRLPFSRKVSSVASALISTLLVFTTLIAVVSFSLYKIIDEIRMFIISLPDVDTMLQSVEGITGDLSQYYDMFNFSKLDIDIVQKFSKQITTVASSALNVTKFVMNKLVSLVVGLPFTIAIGLITFLSTYFFSKDMPNIERRILSIFTSDGRIKARKILRESKYMLGNYIKSYLYLMVLTFIETLLAFTFLGINYSILLSILAAVLDLLPIVGVSAVYIPMAIYYFFNGNNFVAISLIVLLIVVSIIRQIAEPKLVSTSVGIHPLFVIASLFIGLKSFGILGILYFISAILLFKVFKKVEII